MRHCLYIVAVVVVTIYRLFPTYPAVHTHTCAHTDTNTKVEKLLHPSVRK